MTNSHVTHPQWVFAGHASVLREKGCMTAQVAGHALALFAYGDVIYALDNRCPHMGFPLHQGSVKDGILTCHWHHARFDLASGGAFDLFADDARAFPTELRGDDIFVDVAPHGDAGAHHQQRLREGLERDLPLVLAKSVIALLSPATPAGQSSSQTSASAALVPFRMGLDFGTRFRQGGWGQGLTILTCMMNLLPHLHPEDHARAMYHGLSAVARDTGGMAPRFTVQPLPVAVQDIATLKRWFRQFVDVRDAEGAERCVVSAVRAGASRQALADMLFAAVTDHRYLSTGHPLDFTNKALEAIDWMDWPPAMVEQVLSSLVSGYASAERMEESNAWRHPVDLVVLIERACDALETAKGRPAKDTTTNANTLDPAITAILLGEDPHAIVDALLAALNAGASEEAVAGLVAYAAALRIARFHTSNEFGDWDTALHTFTFANAVHQGLRRLHASGGVARTDLSRGIFDAAMSLYLDRFLNVPAARVPAPDEPSQGSLNDLVALLDRQQQVEAAAEAIAPFAYQPACAGAVTAMLGKLLLREDRNFHTIQSLEAAVRQQGVLRDDAVAGGQVLIAAARYLAAHAPTMRAQGQTFNIAMRLARGEKLFEG